MHQYNQNKTIRTDLKFSVSMVVIASVVILLIGSTSTVMAHHDHHHDSGGSGSSGGGSSDPQPTCGFAQTLGTDGLCHYSLNGAINECAHNLPECVTLGKIVLGGL